MTLNGLDLFDRELALFGKPVDSYNPDDLIGETGVLEERHHALNWLLGHELKYSDVDTST